MFCLNSKSTTKGEIIEPMRLTLSASQNMASNIVLILEIEHYRVYSRNIHKTNNAFNCTKFCHVCNSNKSHKPKCDNSTNLNHNHLCK